MAGSTTLADLKNLDNTSAFSVSPAMGATASYAASDLLRPHSAACSQMPVPVMATPAPEKSGTERVGRSMQQNGLAALASNTAAPAASLRAGAPRRQQADSATAVSAVGAAAGPALGAQQQAQQRPLTKDEKKMVRANALAAWQDSITTVPFTFSIETSLQELSADDRKVFMHKLDLPEDTDKERFIIHRVSAAADGDSVKRMGVAFPQLTDSARKLSHGNGTLSDQYHVEVTTPMQNAQQVAQCFERKEVLNPRYVHNYGQYTSADDLIKASLTWVPTMKHFHVPVNSPIGSVMMSDTNKQFKMVPALVQSEDNQYYIVQQNDTVVRQLAERIEKEILTSRGFQNALVGSTIQTKLVPLTADKRWDHLKLDTEAAEAELVRPFTVTIRGEMEVFKMSKPAAAATATAKRQ